MSVPDKELHYFAYGSNLCTPRLRARVPSARFETAAALPGYTLRFDKDGADGSAKCNIRAGGAGDAVHGVIWRIAAREKAVLDSVEGPQYFTWWRTLILGERELPVCTYVARPGGTRERIFPYDWYLDFVIAGAREHGLPPEYIEHLGRVRANRDPDDHRAALNRRLLNGEES